MLEAASAKHLLKHWINSSNGIHSFLTFDSLASVDNITKFARDVDFVWGSDKANIWLNSHNPSVVVSKYIPFCRDPTPHVVNESGLEWWTEHHPDLVLYQCDRVTPAWECFSGEG